MGSGERLGVEVRSGIGGLEETVEYAVMIILGELDVLIFEREMLGRSKGLA